jgi:hypothetical protein
MTVFVFLISSSPLLLWVKLSGRFSFLNDFKFRPPLEGDRWAHLSMSVSPNAGPASEGGGMGLGVETDDQMSIEASKEKPAQERANSRGSAKGHP